jgi:RNA polymerase sigma factor (sigma-70 family)
MSPLAISLRFLQTQPDQRLVDLARAGHERAFEALVRRYRGPLLAYCRRVAPRATPPEDILQQGLLLAWRALSGGAEVRDPRAWLYRIVHNVAITAVRAGGELGEAVAPEPGAPGVEQLFEQRMAAREALAGLAGLPDLQRQVMVSAAIDGRSHDEIAAALGLSRGSVRGLIYRARSTLRAAAAAVIPAPVIEWAVGDAGGASAGLAGAGSAGLGALILKGGAVLAVGAAAGTAGIVLGHPSHHAHHAGAAAALSASGERAGVSGGSPASSTGGVTRLAALAVGPAPTAAGAAEGGGRQAGSAGRGVRGGAQGRGGHDGSGDGRGSQQTSGGDGSQTSGGDGSGSRGDGSGSSGGGSDGTTGSNGGGDHQATTATTESDGGDHPTSTPTSPTGSDGGGSGGGGSSALSGDSADGGGSSGSDGGSSTTPATTSTTTTSTTTPSITTASSSGSNSTPSGSDH